MANPIIIAARLGQKRSALSPIEEELTKLLKRQEELENAVEDAETDEDLDTLEKEIDELEAELAGKKDEKTKLQEEIDGLEKELEEANEGTEINENKERGRDMNKTIENPETREIREGINEYIRSKGVVREQVTSVEAGALIPEEILSPVREKTEELNLEDYVRVVSVNSGSGKYPVIKKSNSRMISVAELEKNPELAAPKFDEVLYDIETFRGYIPVSQEAIDDAQFDLTGLVAEEIDDQERNTKNAEIIAAMKAMPQKTITGLDGIKTLLNVDIKSIYNTKLFVSSSLWNELDLLKDNEGRYLLQNDPTSPTGKSISGKPVIKLDDTIIGTSDGDLVGFIGDAQEAITLFDRKRASVKWTDNDIYGELLASFVRFDTQNVDDAAGFYVTYVPEAPQA